MFMCVCVYNVYIYIYILIYIHTYIYIHIHIHIHIHIRIHIHIHIHIHTHTIYMCMYVGRLLRPRKGTKWGQHFWGHCKFLIFDRGTFWVLSLAYFYLPKSARAYLVPRSVKVHHFCSGPISVDPICPQPKTAPPDS